MSKVAALGDGPVLFSYQGKQEIIPLSLVQFDGGQVSVPSRAQDGSSAALASWLQYLVAQGRVVEGTRPAGSVAFELRSAVSGASGNDVVVTVARNPNPNTPMVDVTVVAEQVYDDLRRSTLEATLGKVGGPPGKHPGLLRVLSVAANGPEPAEKKATAVAATNTTPEQWPVDGENNPATTAFTLQAWKSGAEAGAPAAPRTTVQVSNLRTVGTSKMFTLTVRWTRTVTDVSAANLAAKLAELDFAVAFTPAAPTALPAPGTIRLGGGADPAAATAPVVAAT